MTAIALPARIRSRRGRMGLALAGATVLHALVLLGLGFQPPVAEPLPPSPLEIRLAGIAQQERDGMGRETPRPAPEPILEPPEETTRADAPAPEAPPAPEEPAPIEPPSPAPAPASPPPVTTRQAPEPEVAEPPAPSAEQLMRNAFTLARRSDTTAPATATPDLREKVISENTHETEYAFYVRAWRRKVERIGNLNYPAEIRRRNLSGHLILDVTLDADGGLRDVQILRSSGHPTLDEAAVRIVRLAAPYAPFPDSIRAETDVLHIIRTWRFLEEHRWQGGR